MACESDMVGRLGRFRGTIGDPLTLEGQLWPLTRVMEGCR